MTVYPLGVLRALALETQRLTTPNGLEPHPTLDSVYETIDALGGVQIDTLQMVARAHYLTLWSRHGTYAPHILDDLFARERKLFEDWYHAACYIPMHEYRYQMPRQRKVRENGHNWYANWITEPGNREMVSAVIERIRAEGGLRVSDFENPGQRRGSWWDWKPAKVALEYAYAYGDLMISRREKFQRVYDLRERVLPAHVDTSEPTEAERNRFFVERGAKAIGVGLHRNPGDYTWMKITVSRPIVKELLKDGTLLEIQGETVNGVQPLVIHRDNLPLLEKAASGEIHPQRTTFLNPWDNFWWAQDRDEVLWGFQHIIEAYVPQPKRIYGYYLMPILHKDRLIGRLDPKLDRKTHTLHIRALHLEPNIELTDELIADISVVLKDFMKFHHAKELVIEKSNPEFFGQMLSKNMT